MSRVHRLLVPLSMTAIAAFVGVGLAATPGCGFQCTSQFDCGEASYCTGGPDNPGRCQTDCYTNKDCFAPFSSAQLNRSGGLCTATGRCIGPGMPPIVGERKPTDTDRVPDRVEGYNDTPATGPAFIINNIAIAEENQGFDIDGVCTGNDCIDNKLHRLGPLANTQVRQGLTSGETLLLLELAGLDDTYRGDAKSLTVKIYGARDADEPFFPNNNFSTPPGYQECCEFRINPYSITANPRQARARAPSRIDRGRLRSLVPVPVQFTLTVGAPPHPEIKLERVFLSGRVPVNQNSIDEGLLGGAVPMSTLARIENPYCKSINARCPSALGNSSLIDLVSTLFGPTPDVDLDFDGLECALDTDGNGLIDLCCDGAGPGTPACQLSGTSCINGASPVGPTSPNDANSCAKSPLLADGYSIGMTFTAVKATVVGIGR